MFSPSPLMLSLCGAAILAAPGRSMAADEDQPAVPEPPVPAAVAESLAGARAEAAALREENARLRLQAEAVGLAGLNNELRPLQQRLVAAVADYRLAQDKVLELTDRVVSLSEASLYLLSAGNDPAARERLQQELAAANQVLVTAKIQAAAAPVPLDSAKVISLKDDLGLAVLNSGSESGLRLGTPMRIVRADQTVASGLVVDVRNRISGLLLTSASPAGTVRVGDQAQPETISTVK